MNIAVTASGSTIESQVFSDFSHTPYLLIVNVETMDCSAHKNIAGSGADVALAHRTVEHRCEAIITGKLTEAAFDIVADNGITRFIAVNMTVKEALEAMENRQLELIRNPQGTSQCSGDHHH